MSEELTERRVAMNTRGQPRTLRVRHLAGDRFDVDVRGHRLTVDQPTSDGGSDSGPSPVELFVAGLAACVAHYARRYLQRHALPDDVSVGVSWSMASQPNRVGAVDMRIELSEEIPPAHRVRLLAVASHCTVHNSLTQAPTVAVSLENTATIKQRGAA